MAVAEIANTLIIFKKAKIRFKSFHWIFFFFGPLKKGIRYDDRKEEKCDIDNDE